LSDEKVFLTVAPSPRSTALLSRIKLFPDKREVKTEKMRGKYIRQTMRRNK